MLTPFFQFSFLCVVALANLCLGFTIASRLGFGPPLGLLFQLETTVPMRLHESPELERDGNIIEEPVADEKPVVEIDAVVPDESTEDDMTTDTASASSQEESVQDAAEV